MLLALFVTVVVLTSTFAQAAYVLVPSFKGKIHNYSTVPNDQLEVSVRVECDYKSGANNGTDGNFVFAAFSAKEIRRMAASLTEMSIYEIPAIQSNALTPNWLMESKELSVKLTRF